MALGKVGGRGAAGPAQASTESYGEGQVDRWDERLERSPAPALDPRRPDDGGLRRARAVDAYVERRAAERPRLHVVGGK